MLIRLPIILPVRLRRERVSLQDVIKPTAPPAADIARLMRPGVGERSSAAFLTWSASHFYSLGVPASGSVKVARFVSGKEASKAEERYGLSK